jgi:hypothetical protein
MVHLGIQSWQGPLLQLHIDISLRHLQSVLPIGKEIEGCSAVRTQAHISPL